MLFCFKPYSACDNIGRIAAEALTAEHRDLDMAEEKTIATIYEASDFWDEHDLGMFDDAEGVNGIKVTLNLEEPSSL